ncbi:Geranylgeranyl transferase type-2 subunit alpha [Morella rubra]|uniref:Geranylgeranyl transferase type-2 subunit alpha n=1 Tax=Morella rubra TaxID=262757 RepID=A0A6A1UVR1_9ROSI|nr:Geranylgeranyl transferase type-2 subunit alpha [Morella rubra]
MHGRPRKAPKPEDAAASAAKVEKLRSLQSQFLSNHHNKIYTREALEVNAKLLEINPEYYTAWNFRKLAVEHRMSQPDSDPDSVKSILNEELKVVESALKQNFKSYGAWHHRKWVLSKGHSSIDNELRLLDRYQKVDPRNFHAWNYRRCVLLSNLLKRKVQRFFPKEVVLNEEYNLVHQALFTDPDDQSGWFYHLWLLDQTVKADVPLLVSSWPAHDDLILLGDRNLDDCALSPFTTFHFYSGTFPLIVCFDQAVEGVNSSTISVETVLNTEKELTWKPLSINDSKTSQVWVTHLNYPDAKLQSSEAYPVEVRVGHSKGIISSSGFLLNHTSRFVFKVLLQPIEKDPAGHGGEMISWGDGNFLLYETPSQKSNPMISLDQMNIMDEHEQKSSQWRAETIANEIALFQELLSEINCKIGKLTLARLLMARDILLSPCANKTVHSEEVIKLYDDLTNSDPPHSQYYKDERSLVLLQQITSSRESLLRYCFRHRDGTSSLIDNSFCLRLNNLSLSRMGSIEKLLWVQMLDLSHNELQSIEGLEAMQLLSCLNLSNNRLSSFTALGPLRLLKSLLVLDISFNEIGSHSIDTTRYLCPSPLSHSEEIVQSYDETVTGGVSLTDYWEAFLIFRGLNLSQLDIHGNAVADEKLNSFLVKIVPTLKWLDGGKLH